MWKQRNYRGAKKYAVELTYEQRSHLLDFLKRGKGKVPTLTRACLSLLSAVDRSNVSIAEVLKIDPRAVGDIRKRITEETRRLTRRLEFHYTPKHGWWLGVVGVTFSIFVRQCSEQCLPDTNSVSREVID